METGLGSVSSLLPPAVAVTIATPYSYYSYPFLFCSHHKGQDCVRRIPASLFPYFLPSNTNISLPQVAIETLQNDGNEADIDRDQTKVILLTESGALPQNVYKSKTSTVIRVPQLPKTANSPRNRPVL